MDNTTRITVRTSNSSPVSVKESNGSKVRLDEKSQAFFRNGHSPYIDSVTGTWWVFDDKTQQYIDSGALAEIGAVDSELSLTSKNPISNCAITKEVNSKVGETNIKELKAIDIDVLWEAL